MFRHKNSFVDGTKSKNAIPIKGVIEVQIRGLINSGFIKILVSESRLIRTINITLIKLQSIKYLCFKLYMIISYHTALI